MFTLDSFIQQSPCLGIFSALILGGVGFPLPEDAVLITSGLLLANKTVRTLPNLIVIHTGLLTADSFLYLMGRKY